MYLFTYLPFVTLITSRFQGHTSPAFPGGLVGTMPGVIASHEGEVAVQKMLKVPVSGNPAHARLPAPHAQRIALSPLLALGTVDARGRPWTTVLGGEAGFAGAVAENVLGVRSLMDGGDPVMEALWEGGTGRGSADGDGEVVQRDALLAGLSIDPMTQDRVKIGGRLVVAARPRGEGPVQLAMTVDECLGNCPKYINKRRIRPRVVSKGNVVEKGQLLSEAAVSLVRKADMIFLSTEYGGKMDTNHRGGPPGFVRVEKNDSEGISLVYPEYSGNNLYQTLGNLRMNPAIGIVIPDFDSADALFVTGQAEILWGEEARSVIARTKLAIRIRVLEARFIKGCLPFTGELVERSMYNPPMRPLLKESDVPLASDSAGLKARLVDREQLTPTINRYKFELEGGRLNGWHAGQYATFDFEPELSTGYAHMNDDDPQSLNEDYKRTFTISSIPGDGKTLEITAKLHGPATTFLNKHILRVPLELTLLGFGGLEAFRMDVSRESVFIAGGVGITPLLAQAPAILSQHENSRLSVLWSLRREDVNLAVDSFSRCEGLAEVTGVFLTGEGDGSEAELLKKSGAKVEERRLGGDDLKIWKGRKLPFYACASGTLLASVQGWLEGESIVWEEFAY